MFGINDQIASAVEAFSAEFNRFAQEYPLIAQSVKILVLLAVVLVATRAVMGLIRFVFGLPTVAERAERTRVQLRGTKLAQTITPRRWPGIDQTGTGQIATGVEDYTGRDERR